MKSALVSPLSLVTPAAFVRQHLSITLLRVITPATAKSDCFGSPLHCYSMAHTASLVLFCLDAKKYQKRSRQNNCSAVLPGLRLPLCGGFIDSQQEGYIIAEGLHRCQRLLTVFCRIAAFRFFMSRETTGFERPMIGIDRKCKY